ncbi:MAG: hypothetical protein KBS95_03635 [Alistipes sp.]|nr:hypothetical protein [Candidatus Alistipes equi]
MWRRILYIFAYLVIWSGIVLCIVYVARLSSAHWDGLHINELVIKTHNSHALQSLISQDEIIKILSKNGVNPLHKDVDSIDMSHIRDLVQMKQCVQQCKVWSTYSGKFNIDVKTFTPLFRLMVDGYDCFITEQGYIFHPDPCGSFYTDIVTGKYQPPFAKDYTGDVKQHFLKELFPIKKAIKTCLAEEKKSQFQIDSIQKALKQRKKAKLRKSFFESSKHFKKRNEDFAKETDYLCKKLAEEISQRKEALSQMQIFKEKTQLMLQQTTNAHSQFYKLLNFIKYLQRDSLFSAETVQLIAQTTSIGNISLSLVMRSGDYCLKVGELQGIEQKLEKAKSFLGKTLYKHKIGEMKEVDVSVDGVVITRQ